MIIDKSFHHSDNPTCFLCKNRIYDLDKGDICRLNGEKVELWWTCNCWDR